MSAMMMPIASARHASRRARSSLIARGHRARRRRRRRRRRRVHPLPISTSSHSETRARIHSSLDDVDAIMNGFHSIQTTEGAGGATRVNDEQCK